jgi:hypothetical protein
MPILQNPSIFNPVLNFNFNNLNPFSYAFQESYTDYSDDGDSFFDNSPSIEELKSGTKSVTLKYYLNEKEHNIDYTVYQGLNDYIASLPRTISYYSTPPTTKDFILKDIEQEKQRSFLTELVETISNITDNKDDQARIAISIVQNIPYEWSSLYVIILSDEGEFPYEVLYTQDGVCGEKSNLLLFLLRELGFGVVAFEFESDNHRAIGIKCPMQYSFRNSGYCFVETTVPSIITDGENDYVGAGKLGTYILIEISNGISFDSVSEEYYDALEYRQLIALSDASGGILDQYSYNRWMELVNKYGIQFG